MTIRVYTPAMQAVGSFDNDKITEQKPIGFPGEGSVVKRAGPLFYWAWAHAKQEGYIPLHPHSGFEIITYVVQGKAEHGDSLGTTSVVGAGGAQVMQTGSGVSHEERFIGPDMEGFQIWFEPNLREAVKEAPTYAEYKHEDFPWTQADGVSVKTVIGENSPIELKSKIGMWDILLEAGASYRHRLLPENCMAALAIRGKGVWRAKTTGKSEAFQEKDFSLVEALNEEECILEAQGDILRLILIEAPRQVDYPLYPKR